MANFSETPSLTSAAARSIEVRTPTNRLLNSFWWNHDEVLRGVGLLIAVLGALRPFFEK